jgi:cytochrome c-type biogenesis protein CcmH/NrfG
MADSFDSSSRMIGQSGAAGHHDPAQTGEARVGSVVTEFLDAARSAAESLLEEQKRQVAGRVSGVGEALRGAVGSLDRSQNAIVARVVEQAAHRVENFSRTLRNRRWNELVADTEDYARRQPTLFVLGAIATGFLLGRLFWSTMGSEQQVADATRRGESTRAVTAAVSSGSGTSAGDELTGDPSLPSGGMEAR